MNRIQRKNAEELQREFQNDSIIKLFNETIADVLMVAMPKRIYFGEEPFDMEIVYSDEVEELLNKLKTERDKYIKNTYG